uniref:Uncharacterized protein n=1 Tax=Cacopsylla melanoneura TaxID=428564 RepID=A0A8D8TWD6_9HEMI
MYSNASAMNVHIPSGYYLPRIARKVKCFPGRILCAVPFFNGFNFYMFVWNKFPTGGQDPPVLKFHEFYITSSSEFNIKRARRARHFTALVLPSSGASSCCLHYEGT